MVNNRDTVSRFPGVVAESRSPVTNSTFLPASNRLIAFSRRSSRLEGRMKQRRLQKPYREESRQPLTPIKPFDPVTRMRSAGQDDISRIHLLDPTSVFQVLADFPASAATLNRFVGGILGALGDWHGRLPGSGSTSRVTWKILF